MTLSSQGGARPSLSPAPGRRSLILGAGAAGFVAAGTHGYAQTRAAQTAPMADHTIRIAPLSLEIAPGKVIQTTGYNGTVPGPTLLLLQSRPVAIEVVNDSGYPNLIHWHGLYLPSEQDGAAEEGSPIIPPGQSYLYSFTPNPAGTRWYHSRAMAGQI